MLPHFLELLEELNFVNVWFLVLTMELSVIRVILLLLLIVYTYSLLQSRYGTKYFIYLSPHNNLMRWALLLFLFYAQGN